MWYLANWLSESEETKPQTAARPQLNYDWLSTQTIFQNQIKVFKVF